MDALSILTAPVPTASGNSYGGLLTPKPLPIAPAPAPTPNATTMLSNRPIDAPIPSVSKSSPLSFLSNPLPTNIAKMPSAGVPIPKPVTTTPVAPALNGLSPVMKALASPLSSNIVSQFKPTTTLPTDLNQPAPKMNLPASYTQATNFAKDGYEGIKEFSSEPNAERGATTEKALGDFVKGTANFAQDLGNLFLNHTAVPALDAMTGKNFAPSTGMDLRTSEQKQYDSEMATYQQALQKAFDAPDNEKVVIPTKPAPPPFNPANFAGNLVGQSLGYIAGGEALEPVMSALEKSSPVLKVFGKTILNAALPAVMQQLNPIPQGETRGSIFLKGLPSDLLFGLTTLIPGSTNQGIATGISQFGLGKLQGVPTGQNILNSAVMAIFGMVNGQGPRSTETGVGAPDISTLEGLKQRATEILNTPLGDKPDARDVLIKGMAHEFMNSSEEEQKGFMTQAKALAQKVIDRYNEAKANSGTQGGFIKNPLASADENNPKGEPVGFEEESTPEIPPDLQPLADEAKKYPTAEEFVKAQTARPDYGYGHSPNADGVPAFDLTAKVDGEQMIPKDMYTQWYGSRGTPSDLESIAALKKIKGNPEAEVTIYRASPKNEWNYGDWTTLSKKYAQQHATGNTGFKVFSKVVQAKDLKWAMDDINEFGYFPESTKSQLTDFYNKAIGVNNSLTNAEHGNKLLPYESRSSGVPNTTPNNNRPNLGGQNVQGNGALKDGLSGLRGSLRDDGRSTGPNRRITDQESQGVHDTGRSEKRTADDIREIEIDIEQRSSGFSGLKTADRFALAARMLRSYGIPDSIATRLELVGKNLPTYIADKFDGIGLARPDANGAVSIHNGRWTLDINPKQLETQIFQGTRLIDHEISGHLTYNFAPPAVRTKINEWAKATLKNRKLFDNIWNGARGMDAKKMAITQHSYLFDSIQRVYTRMSDDLSSEAAFNILQKTGYITGDRQIPHNPSPSRLSSAVDIKQEVLKWIAKETDNLGGVLPRSLKTYLNNGASGMANEIFARAVEYAAEHPESFKGSLGTLIKKLAVGESDANYFHSESFPHTYDTMADKIPEEGSEKYRDIEKANKEYLKTLAKENAPTPTPSELEQKVDQLKQVQEDLRTTLQEHPAKDLIKYTSNRQLPEVSSNATSKYGQHGDVINEAAMRYDDMDEAQKGVDEYFKTSDRLVQTNAELKEAREALAKEKLAVKDEKSANVLLQRKMTPAEEAIAARDTAIAKEKGLKAAVEERQKFFEQAALDRAKYERAVEKAHADAKVKERSFIKDTKAAVFSRLSGVDEETKKIVLKYEADKAVAHEAGRNVGQVYKDLRQVSGMQDIIDQQAGKKNPVFKDFFDDAYTNAKRLGVTDMNYQEDYMPQLWKNTNPEIKAAIEKYFKDHQITPEQTEQYLSGATLPDEIVLRLRVHPTFSYKKSIPDYATGIKYGLTPRYTNPVDLMSYYTEHLGKVIANRDFIKKLISEHKVLNTFDAPRSWREINIPGITKGQYAAPKELERLLAGMFPPDAEQLSLSQGWRQKGLEMTGNVARGMQNFAFYGLGTGNINFWGIGQLVKEITTLTGALPNDTIRAVLGDPNFTSTKSSLATISRFLTSNFNKPTAKLFEDLAPTFKEMAEQGINTQNRLGNIDAKDWGDIFSDLKKGKVGEVIGGIGAKSMSRTKDSFLPLQQAITFRDAKAAAIKQGIPEDMAERLAGEVVKHYSSALKFTGNSPTQRNFADTFLMARNTRAGALGFFWQSMKDATWGFNDPAGFKNRDFITGLIISLIAYNLINKKTTGHYMFENDPNDKFNVILPIPPAIGAHMAGYKPGDTFKFPLLPSLSYGIRSLVGAIGDYGTGNFTAGNSSLLGLASIPAQTIAQTFFNQDYFGSPIYKDSDPTSIKIQKIAANTSANISPAPIRSAINLMEGKTPLYQALYNAAFLPGTFSTAIKDANSDIYNLIAQQSAATAESLLTAKRIDESLSKQPAAQANAQLNLLKTSNPQLYGEIKKLVVDRKAGLTQTESLMKELDVGNGARAKYVDSQIMKLPTSAARNAYLQELIQKKVVTPAVLAQIKALRANANKQ